MVPAIRRTGVQPDNPHKPTLPSFPDVPCLTCLTPPPQLGSIYGLYRFLTYAHTLVEAGHQHYRTWEKSQHDAVKEARAKEKAKERRKRAKSEAAGDTKKPAGGREGRPEPEPVEKTVNESPHPRAPTGPRP